MYKVIKIVAKSHGLKIDKALQDYLPQVSRRVLRRALDSGSIYVNKKLERFASRTVVTGDIIEIKRKALEVSKEKTSLDSFEIKEPFVIYEDDLILAINKPPFVPSQKTKNPTTEDAKAILISYLKRQQKEIPKELILCHRLDKETSGVLVFAKSKSSCEWIMAQFKERKCYKKYEALCSGRPKEKTWARKDFLSSLDNKEQRVRLVTVGGKVAITNFRCLEVFEKEKVALIECEPKTGRTHQIRVQLAQEGLPILGDKKYTPEGKRKLRDLYPHHLLHSKSLKIMLSPKSSSFVTIEAEAPSSFKITKE